MSDISSCAIDFTHSLKEVEIILKWAEKYPREYDVCIKSALLFLVAKFETFLEDLVSNYIQTIEKKGLSPRHFPEIMKLHSIDNIISETFIADVRKHKPRALQTIIKLSRLCVGDDSISSIDIDKSFDYGKHGEKAIDHLFSRIGVEDVFSLCDIYELRDTLAGKNRVKINMVADINSLTNHRNSILHNDSTPNITHLQIASYEKHLIQFSKKITKVLESQLDNLVAITA
jgi:hypothetical protein